MDYRIHSREYLARARKRLDEDTPEGLFYAAFEIRCGIESRLRQYLDAQHDISEKKRKGWQIAKLARNLEAAFVSGDKIIEFAISDKDNGPRRYTLYYTPVTKKLQKMGEKIGDLMHGMKRFRPEDDPWWKKTREFLESAYDELAKASVGNMLGAPLIDPKTQRISFTAEPRPDENITDPMRAIGQVGTVVYAAVSYLKVLPEPEE